MTWGEPPAAVKEKIEQLKTKAAAKGRTLSYGIRLHVIVRETNEAAWQAADELLSHVNDDTIAAAQAKFAQMDSVGQQRMAALHGGRRDNLEISPNLWAGIDWYVVAQAPHCWATHKLLPRVFKSMPIWALITLFFRLSTLRRGVSVC